MEQTLSLAAKTLTSPVVLCFALGLVVALIRSGIAFPKVVSNVLGLYLLFAIGFKGGAGVAEHGADATLAIGLVTGALLSLCIPLLAFFLLQRFTGLDRTDAAAVSAHYGSISIVTFTAAIALLGVMGTAYEGWMVAVAAVMEAPAILTALVLARGGLFAAQAVSVAGGTMVAGGQGPSFNPSALYGPLREAVLNKAFVVLMSAFALGWFAGPQGLANAEPLLIWPFQVLLCVFLLDMGLAAGRGLKASARDLTPPLLAFGIVMPLIGAGLGLTAGALIGLSEGGTALLGVLAASASYIAAPAAMRAALPEARPEIYLTLSLGITFPFNLLLGIPLYISIAGWLVG
ncbi:MAG: sodium-dependent bicarbonate transport family permease [Pseudomonadota bacterium]